MTPDRIDRGARRLLTAVVRVVLAASAAISCAAFAFSFPSAVTIAPQCVARVDKAALQAMNRTNPLGQMQIFGDPTVFDPHLLRVTVTVYGARTEVYAVDVTIDDSCTVLSASTRLESNEWPVR
jgi:ABC-type transport system substrate-binding protein